MYDGTTPVNERFWALMVSPLFVVETKVGHL